MRLQIRPLNWSRVRIGMRAKLIVSFLVVVFPAFLLLVVSDYRHYVYRQDAILEDSRVLAQAVGAVVEARLDEAAGLARQVRALRALRPAGGGGQALEQLLREHPGYLEAFDLDSRGHVTAAAPPGQQPVVHVATLGRLTASPSPVVSDLLLSGPDKRPAVQVLVPDWTGGSFQGAAGVTLDALMLGTEAANALQGSGHGLTLCDRGAWAVYSTLDPNAPWEERDYSASVHVRQALQGRPQSFSGAVDPLDGRAYLGAAVPIPDLGWAVCVFQPAQPTLSQLRSQTINDLVLLAALVIIGVLAATLIGNWFAAPVVRLAQHARGLGQGQLNERIDVRTGDELEDLAAAFNVMARQLEERDRRLRARTAELDGIITQSADGIAIHGPQGELVRLNPAGIQILGHGPGHLGMSLAEQAVCLKMRAPSGGPIDPAELPVAAALRGETRVAQELRIETETGQERYVAFSASPLIDAHGRIYGAVSTFRDMTQAHRAQREKDDFVSVVSHELKTPITSIKGYAQMLLRRADEAGGDERDLKGLRIINDEVDRMVDLINQLLDVSRLETQRLELNLDRVDLVRLTADAVDRLQMTTNRHTLRLRAPQGPVWVRGDAMRLVQVLGNLIMNAIKYSPAGGPIEVSLESQEERAWVSVRDWGIGIAPEDQPHLFERFYRGTRRGSTPLTGMGLGLYISREIVQRHHGDIVFHSQPGQGTTFLFWLPLAAEPQPANPTPQ